MVQLSTNMKQALNLYLSKQVLQVALFGFLSGLTLMLSGNTLNFWLSKMGIDKAIIGMFSLVAIPYCFKFLFAPLVDWVKPKYLTNMVGNKKSWILISHIFLILFVILLGRSDPEINYIHTAIYAVFVALATIFQDIVLDLIRVEILDDKHRAAGSVTYTVGYRIGTMVSGVGAIYLSSYYSWSFIYNLMAIIIAITSVIILCQDYKIIKPNSNIPIKLSFYNLFIAPLLSLAPGKQIILVLLLCVTYRISDNMVVVMINSLLLELGYSTQEIALGNKLCGYVATIIGGFVGGFYLSSNSLFKSMYSFAFITMIAHSLLLILLALDHNLYVMMTITFISAFCGGLNMVAYFAYITGLCKGPNIATQYAFLSSVMGISRVILPSFSGFIVDYLNWYGYITIIIMLSFPALIILRKLKRVI